MGFACLMYVDAFILAFRARAKVSILSFGLCTLMGFAYWIPLFLYTIHAISEKSYRGNIQPILFTVYVVIWTLPTADWIWRLRQANDEDRRVSRYLK